MKNMFCNFQRPLEVVFVMFNCKWIVFCNLQYTKRSSYGRMLALRNLDDTDATVGSRMWKEMTMITLPILEVDFQNPRVWSPIVFHAGVDPSSRDCYDSNFPFNVVS